jgi:hypothetical protein
VSGRDRWTDLGSMGSKISDFPKLFIAADEAALVPIAWDRKYIKFPIFERANPD